MGHLEQPKRILYLAHGGSMGGGQRQLLYLIENLDRQVYEPLVVCPKDGRFAAALVQLGVEVFVCPLHPWRKFPAGLYRYWDAERLVTLAKKYEVDLVHSSDLWLSGYMAWIARRLRIPSVLHVRTPISTRIFTSIAVIRLQKSLLSQGK